MTTGIFPHPFSQPPGAIRAYTSLPDGIEGCATRTNNNGAYNAPYEIQLTPVIKAIFCIVLI